MNTPEWMQIGLNILGFLALCLLLPQAIGLLLLHRSWNRHWTSKIAVVFVPAVLFFIASVVYWNITAIRMRGAGEYPCSLFGMLAWMTTWIGSALNIVVSLAILISLGVRRRRNRLSGDSRLLTSG